MKKWLALTLLCAGVAFAPVATAQDGSPPAGDPSRIAAAQTLLDLSGYEQQLDYVFDKLIPIFAQSVIGILQADPGSKAMVDHLITNGKGGQGRLVTILSEEFRKSIKAQYPQMMASAAKEYAAAFTLTELQAISTFYQSPAGAKSLLIMPELQEKLGKTGEQYGRIAGAEAGEKGFQRAIEEMLPQSGNGKL